MSEMLSRSTCRPCSERSAFVDSTTRSDRPLRSEMICSMVMSPTIERSEPSSDSLMMSVSAPCCERKRWAARRTPSSVPDTLKLIEALIAILMRFLSTPSTVMPIWRCSSEIEKPCCRIGHTNVRPPITTRWPLPVSPGAGRPAPRPTITSASFGGTRRMRRAMKVISPSTATMRATTAMIWMSSFVMDDLSRGMPRPGVPDPARGGDLLRDDLDAGAGVLDDAHAHALGDGVVRVGEAALDLVGTVEADLAAGRGDRRARDARQAERRCWHAVRALGQPLHEEHGDDVGDDRQHRGENVRPERVEAVRRGEGAGCPEHHGRDPQGGARDGAVADVEVVEDVADDERDQQHGEADASDDQEGQHGVSCKGAVRAGPSTLASGWDPVSNPGTGCGKRAPGSCCRGIRPSRQHDDSAVTAGRRARQRGDNARGARWVTS